MICETEGIMETQPKVFLNKDRKIYYRINGIIYENGNDRVR